VFGITCSGPTLSPAGDSDPFRLPPEHVLAAILSSTEDGLLSYSLDGTLQFWSAGAESLYGYAAAEIIGQPVTVLVPVYELWAHEEVLALAKSGTFRCGEDAERLRKDGSRIHVGLQRAAVRDETGAVVGLVETARHGWPADSDAGDEQLRPLVEQMPAILWTTDQDLRITSYWGSGLGPTKIEPADLVGQTLYDYLKCQDPHAAPIAKHAEALNGVPSYFEYRHGSRHFAVHVGPLRGASGEITGCIGAGIDITDRKKSEDHNRYQATHDALTGLANYREFVDTLEREVRRAERSNHSFALLLLDLDELKAINDKYGHLAGNRALKKLSGVIKDHCRATDLAARYGGDEFALVLIDADPGIANRIAQRIQRALRDSRERPAINVSIGIAVYPEHGRTACELLEAADRHLYKRKKAAQAHSVTVG
jgi:diguanylate cyclase (GGDEF)-like protein/PAS domain S-box-containing protein